MANIVWPISTCGRYRLCLWPMWSSMWPIWLWPIWFVADIDVISPNTVPFHMSDTVSYCAIETLSLRPAVFTIFDFKNAVMSILVLVPTKFKSCPCRSSPSQVLFLNLACNTHSIVLMVICLFSVMGFTVICCEFSLCHSG